MNHTELCALYQEIVENARAVAAARVVALVQRSPDGRTARLLAHAGLGSGTLARAVAAARQILPGFDLERLVVPARASALLQKVYDTGLPAAAPFEEVAAGTMDARLLRVAASIAGVRQSYVCPVHVDRRVDGTLSFHTVNVLTPAERRICDAFARQAALALENARLYKAEHRRAWQAEHFAATLAHIGGAASLEDAVEALLRGALELLNGVHGLVRVIDPDTGLRTVEMQLFPDGTLRVDRDAGPLAPGSYGQRLLSGESAILVADYATTDTTGLTNRESLRQWGLRSAVHAAIQVGGRCIGNVSIDHTEPERFGPTELSLAQALASLAGAAIERTRLETDRRMTAEERARLDGALLVARTAAHDLNNALAPVAGFAELLLLEPVVAGDPKAATFARLIFDASQEAAERVRRLQRIIRLEEDVSVLGPDQPLLDLARSTAPAPPSSSSGSPPAAPPRPAGHEG